MDNSTDFAALFSGTGLRLLKPVAPEGVSRLFPDAPVTMNDDETVTVCGVLAPDAGDHVKLVLELASGAGGAASRCVTISLQQNRANTAMSGQVRRYWARAQLASLERFAAQNKEAIAELGKRYSLVTSGTSFIVFEKLEQYRKYNICPPKSLEKEYREYSKDVRYTARYEAGRVRTKISSIKAYTPTVFAASRRLRAS